MENIEKNAENYFKSGLNCAESVLSALCDHFKLDINATPRIATAFGGGFGGTQKTCGALTGGLMVIGLMLGRDDGKGGKAPSYQAAKEFMSWFEQRAESVLCWDISKMDLSIPEQNTAFRAPGGRHETVCIPLVAAVAAYLAEKL